MIFVITGNNFPTTRWQYIGKKGLTQFNRIVTFSFRFRNRQSLFLPAEKQWISMRKKSIISKKAAQQAAFFTFKLLGGLVAGILLLILGFIIVNGIGVINWEFLTAPPEEGMTSGGIFPAIFGTLCLIAGSIIFAFPLGVMSGIYSHEYAGNRHIVKFIRVMTNNLGAIPSIVFGLFGMALFVNTFGFGDSILAGSLTLGLLILPLIIRTTEEALKAIPDVYRTGSYALGATRLQTIRRVILPMAFPNIITGLILSIGRVSGETAPILFTAAAYFLPKLPSGIFDQVMALPYHLYVIATSGTNIEASRPIAYGTALVLIGIVLFMNLLAATLRKYFSKKANLK
jgi:phosphate transport system permease protein